MVGLLLHWYAFGEVYTVMLVYVVVPLGFFAVYLVLHNHYGLLPKKAEQATKPPTAAAEEKKAHGTN